MPKDDEDNGGQYHKEQAQHKPESQAVETSPIGPGTDVSKAGAIPPDKCKT
ncbi:MAG: hypothetical protein V4675_03690 [Verrucomicrobiota bacterium]